MRLRRTGRRGQAAVFIALILFSLVVFLAMATNMGILVNDRIRMQSASDLGAYAAAYKEAQQLNHLVQLNDDILQLAADCRDRLREGDSGGGVWEGDICICEPYSTPAEQVISMCQTQLNDLAQDFVDAARRSAAVEPALQAGGDAMDQNLTGLTGAGSKVVDAGSYRSDASKYTTPDPYTGSPVDTIATYERVTDTAFNYMAILMCPTFGGGCGPNGTAPSDTHYLSTWYVKDDRDPDVWVMALAQGTPQSTYLDIAYSSSGGDGGYFGGSSTGGSDRMYAVSVAKPYEGSVGPAEITGDQRNGNCCADPIFNSSALDYPELAMVEEYRARLAGIHEWDSVSADAAPSDALAATRWASYVDRFRH